MPAPKAITASKQLVVEGRDAEVFFSALLSEVNLSGIQVQDFGGKDELQGFLKALRNVSGFATQVVSLGIVRDAENDPRVAFQSMCSALGNAGLPVPDRPEILAGVSPQVAVLILPNATTAGMLETICLQAVANDPIMQCVDGYFNCVKQHGLLPGNMYKAQVQAFLASRPRPGLRLGQAASAGYWQWDSPVFDHLKQFLQAL